MSSRTDSVDRVVWVRFRGGRRVGQNVWHAVLVAHRGGYFSYCAEFRRADAVELAPDDGPPRNHDRAAGRCRCCSSRLRLPYLVPNKLRVLMAEGAPVTRVSTAEAAVVEPATSR